MVWKSDQKNRHKLSRVINIASKLIGKQQIQLSVLYHNSIKRKTVEEEIFTNGLLFRPQYRL